MELNSQGEYLRSLDEFIDTAESQLDNILQEIGWNKEYILQVINERKDGEKLVTCNVDPNHRIPQKALEKHQEMCSWVSEGYTAEDKKNVPPSSHFFYENNSLVTTVLIDEKLQNDILSQSTLGEASSSSAFQSENHKKVPRTMNRAITDLSVSERLAIYNYVAAQSRNDLKIPLEELQMTSNENLNTSIKEKSRLEVLAEERDYKRRRQSYRAKNVHITKKSYTEILRDVIHNHTEALQTQQTEENVESEMVAQTREIYKNARDHERSHRKRSRSRSRESYQKSNDHHRRQKSSHSKDGEDSSKHSHKEKRHKHKSKKKSHKHERHRQRNSDS